MVLAATSSVSVVLGNRVAVLAGERQEGHSLRSFGKPDNRMTEAIGTFGGDRDGLRSGRQR